MQYPDCTKLHCMMSCGTAKHVSVNCTIYIYIYVVGCVGRVRQCFLFDEGSMLETLDYTIRIGSTPTSLYFDLYICIYICIYITSSLTSKIVNIVHDAIESRARIVDKNGKSYIQLNVTHVEFHVYTIIRLCGRMFIHAGRF